MKYLLFAFLAFSIGLLARIQAQSMPFGGHFEDVQSESDPFQGDWEGRWLSDAVKESDRNIVAQVIARGHGQYLINVLLDFDHRSAPYVSTLGTVEEGVLKFKAGDWEGGFREGRFEGRGYYNNGIVAPVSMAPVKRLSPTLGSEAPDDAIILFDGSSFDEWIPRNVEKIDWQLKAGELMEIAMNSEGKGHALLTRRKFTDLSLHLEFRLPLQARNSGQRRGNSGVHIGGYEIQILDSYGLAGYYNECGAFYRFKAPAVNMCAPPLQWQSYDVSYTAARFDENGQVESWPRFTVSHNGKIIHRDLELKETKDGKLKQPPSKAMPLSLQSHGARVQFRNIWVVPADRK